MIIPMRHALLAGLILLSAGQQPAGGQLHVNGRYGYEIRILDGYEVINTGPEGQRDGVTFRVARREFAAPAPVLDVEPYGKDVVARTAAIGAAYDAAIARPTAACRYGADLVVTRAATPEPAWLEPIYANAVYRLSRPRPDACA